MEGGSRAATDRSPPRSRRGRPSLAELADVALAQGALVGALVRARVSPVGQLVAPLGNDPGIAPAPRRRPEQRMAAVERALRAIDRASRRGLFRPTCLVRSLALVRLLERWGVPRARIRIGVRRAVQGDPAPAGTAPRTRLRAHAWVELAGRPIGDDPRHVARFSPLGSVTSVPLLWR